MQLEVQINSHIKTPRYMQVYSTLHQWIAQGLYPPGSKLDTEDRLCTLFGVSRITVRKAIEMLAAENLVVNRQGKGTFVSGDHANLPVRADMDQRIRKSHALARNSKLKELRITSVLADPSTQKDLLLEAGSRVIFAAYVRVLRGSRIGYVESFIPEQLGIELTASDFRTSTLLTILEDKGIMLSGIDHLIGATLADSRLARILNIPVGAPLVTVKLMMFDMQHRPVERVSAFFRADQYEHHMFMARQTTGQAFARK